MGRAKINLVGKKFGRLVVTGATETSVSGDPLWECLCICGTIKSVRGGDLRRKKHGTRSCGCLAKETARNLLTTHGKTNTSEFNVWSGMRARCYNKNSKDYINWGGRGIEVCDKWRTSFDNFIEDMGPRPPGATIDRTDNAGNYTPGNCKWVSYQQNNNNRRSNRPLTYNGQTHNVSQWARILGISPSTLYCRLNRLSWTVEEALSTPVST